MTGHTPSAEAATDEPLVRVRELSVRFPGVDAVRDVSFDIRPGQIVAVVGESGSGKSVVARTLLGLAGPGAEVSAAAATFDGQDLLGFPEARWRTLRGGRVGMVVQDALGAFDPLRTVGAEVAESLWQHGTVRRREYREEVVRLLTAVGVPDPRLRARQHPHQLSGGLRQRALLASALAARPELLIADEPTTALDTTVQKQILKLLRGRADDGLAVLLISHDLAVVAELADHVHVMRDGAFVEEGPTSRVLGAPEHEYTRELLAAIPSAGTRGRSLTGQYPALASDKPEPGRVLLRAEGVHKSYRAGGSRAPIVAAHDVSLVVRAGETLGVVGESGSGKTTVGRMLAALVEPDSGTVEIDGTPWRRLRGARRRDARRRVQVIYQDPLSAFDPRFTSAQVLAEPLRLKGSARADRMAELLGLVGLAESVLDRPARQLSGGQRQRLAIARALAAEPDVLICDEAVSALDVSIQAQVLDVLSDVQHRLGTAYVFISHDLGVVRHIADQVVVMRAGRVVESGAVPELFDAPQHPHTKELLDSVPGFGDPKALVKPS